MQKVQSLRDALEAALPEFRRDPGDLKLWVENGSSKSRMTETLGIGFAYRLNIYIEETTTDLAIIMLAITRWLRTHQPDLLAPTSPGIGFEADPADVDLWDLLITLDLTENVSITPKPEGGWSLDYLDEPDPMFADTTGLDALADIPDLAEVQLTEDQQ